MSLVTFNTHGLALSCRPEYWHHMNQLAASDWGLNLKVTMCLPSGNLSFRIVCLRRWDSQNQWVFLSHVSEPILPDLLQCGGIVLLLIKGLLFTFIPFVFRFRFRVCCLLVWAFILISSLFCLSLFGFTVWLLLCLLGILFMLHLPKALCKHLLLKVIINKVILKISHW